MKKKNLLFLFSVPFLVFQACTTDVGYEPNNVNMNASPSYRVSDRDELPACKGDFENVAIRVMEFSNVHEDYVCSDGFWIYIGRTEDVSSTRKLPDISELSQETQETRQNFSNVRKSTITDSRDGKTYKVIEFDGVVWMAENLDYETAYSLTSTECEARGVNCGQFYNWRDAVNGGEDYSEICPDGFRLPEQADAEHLANFVGGLPHVLKSKDYWDTEDLRGGTDEIGFNAIPAGFSYSGYPSFHDFGYSAHFWSSEYAKDSYRSAYEIVLYSFYDYIDWYLTDQDNYYNVRCMRDAR